MTAAVVPQFMPRVRPAYIAAWVLYVAAYLALIAFFKGVDVYHTRFGATGPIVLAYNLCRLAFVVYLFWIVHAAGASLLRAIGANAWTDLSPSDRLVAGFFAGTGVWHAALLALGFMGLYTVPVALIVTIPAVAASFPHVAATSFALGGAVADWWDARRSAGRGIIESFLLVLGMLALAAAAWGLVLTKGLLPWGGHDYFTHYFYYYQTVVERGNLWPNDVWYHFYYSKGAGLYFLAMLLTDALAPQLVTLCFFGAATFGMYSFARRLAVSPLWAFAAATLLCFIYIYTPGVGEYRYNGGWGDFEKLHELNAALVFGIVYMTTRAIDGRDPATRLWAAATVSAIVAAVLINITISIYLGGLFSLVALWYAAKRQWPQVGLALGFAATAAMALGLQFLVNYLVTGLLNDQGLLFFWRFADPEKLYRWGALPQVLGVVVHHWLSGGVSNAVPIAGAVSIAPLPIWTRLDLIYPLFSAGALAGIAALLARRLDRANAQTALVFTAAFVVFILFAAAAGPAQPISLFRYGSFVVPIVIALSLAWWSLPSIAFFGRLGALASAWVVPPAVIAACVAATISTYPEGLFGPYLQLAARFVAGRVSIDDAYIWPRRPPGGAIRAGARGAFSFVGPKTRLWSFHIHSYCMLPGCRMETIFSFIMSPRWLDVMFGPADEARRILQEEGLNYFLFTRGIEIRDPLPRAELFSPDNLARYFDVAWTDGETILLTWRGQGTAPLDLSWVAEYRNTAITSATVTNYPYELMKHIYGYLQKTPHPWTAATLARPAGIQVASATYGSSCGLAEGNFSHLLKRDCNGRFTCNFTVNVAGFPDPAPGCKKDFTVNWTCNRRTEIKRVTAPAEAGFGSVVALGCPLEFDGRLP